jgi:hypothetical protein
MGKHSSTEICGDPKDCWIEYDDRSNRTLEEEACMGARELARLHLVMFWISQR